MSTHATIMLKQPGVENWASITVHHDGYISHLGVYLYEYYSTYEKVLELIRMGDADCLYESLTELSSSRSIMKNEPHRSIFYHRDGREELHIVVSANLRDHQNLGSSYEYLFEPERGTWLVRWYNNGWRPLVLEV